MGLGLDSVWEEPPEGLRYLVEKGKVFRLDSLLNLESELVGLSGDLQVMAGPLVVAAFGWDPPVRSVQFELTLLSVDEDGKVGQVDLITGEEAEELENQMERLVTRQIVPRWGEQATHGLVWEDGSLDLGCARPDEVVGKAWNCRLPEGDGERILRQLIEDSLNLLDGLEMNRRRFEEGKPKANLLWPHSFGFRPDLPHLGLRRGLIANFWSDSIRLVGMSKLVGYRHVDRSGFYQGMVVSPKLKRRFWDEEGVGVMVDMRVGELLNGGRGDDARHLIESWDSGLWEPLARAMQSGEEIAGAILCPRADGAGLGVIFPGSEIGRNLPFDGRALEDDQTGGIRLGDAMAKILGS